MERSIRLSEKSTTTANKGVAFFNLPCILRTVFSTFLSSRTRKYTTVIFAAFVITFVMAVMVYAFEDTNQANNTSNNNGSAQQQPLQSSQSASGGSSGPNEDKQPENDQTTTNESLSSSTSVTVNGQAVDVPQGGSYDKTVDVPGGQVHVSGNSSSVASKGTTSNSSTSTTTVNVSSH